MKTRKVIPLALMAALLTSCTTGKVQINEDPKPEETRYTVVAEHKRPDNSFTQGFEFDDNGDLLESSGLYGKSFIQRIKNGEYAPENTFRVDNETEVFAEGLTVINDDVIQLTWKNNIGYIRDKNTFETKGVFQYMGEGWGACYDDTTGVMWRSDGSDTLFGHNVNSWEVTKTAKVNDDSGSIKMINELECVDGEVYANVFTEPYIVKIDPYATSGTTVVEKYDLSPIVKKVTEEKDLTQEQVLNGIAYNDDNGHFYVTGKQWDTVYELELG